MGKALYRKYRSRALSEIVGQDHITTTLTNALKNGKIAHAYLLTGPRGVGKTSIARILAHEVNGLPYSEEPHFDIIEIDAASNNGIEDVRDLRDKILSAPTSAKYKVFIIDEVHMLSKAAFNALLKTLEEPPAHVIFILATTEVHKLPETIISRTQRYSFRPVPAAEVIKHLQHIAKQEKIAVDADALQLIAEHGEGSFRDSISLLDQASSTSDHITSASVEHLLGRAPGEYLEKLIAALATQDSYSCLHILSDLYEHGYEASMIASQLGKILRSSIAQPSDSPALEPAKALSLMRSLLDVPAAYDSQALLEITLLQAFDQAQVPPPAQPDELTSAKKDIAITQKPLVSKKSQHVDRPASEPVPAAISPEAQTVPVETAADVHESATAAHESAPDSPPGPDTADELVDAADTAEIWHQALQELKKTHNTLYGIARMARPSLANNTLTLELTFAFHQKRLNEPKNRAILTKLIEDIRQRPTEIRCITMAAPKPEPSVVDHVSTISNIFGGAELLES